MSAIEEQESVIKSGFYSPKQLFVTSIIGGPAKPLNILSDRSSYFSLILYAPGFSLHTYNNIK